MSLKAYREACTRAELFDQPKPDKEEFLAKHSFLDVSKYEGLIPKTTEIPTMANEDPKEPTARTSEPNTTLNSTQTSFHRIKDVCSTVTNFFRAKLGVKDNLSYSSEPSYIGQTNYDKDHVPLKNADVGFINTGLGPDDNEMTPRASKQRHNADINSALADLEAMEIAENTSLLSRSAVHR